MSATSARVAGLILVIGLAAVAAGCGGGSKSSSSTTTNSLTVTPATTSSSSSSSASSFASAKNCQDLAGLAAKAASAVSASSGNASSALQSESNELHALAQAAPSDIRGDFQTFSTAFSGFLQALHKAGYKLGSKTPPTAAQVAQLSKAAQSFNTPKLRQAEQHLQAWAKQNCKGVHVGG